MIKLILIDFDDTLCMTEQSSFKIENHVAEKLGFLPMTRETHQKNWGKPVQEAIKERFPGIDSNTFMLELAKVFPEFVKKNEIDVISDINYEVLNKLKILGLKVAILTSRTLGEARHLLHVNHPLSSHIDAFYHKENVTYIKPDPRVFEKALDEFKVKPNEVVYIGDSLSDATCAKSAGLHFIALLESKLRTKNYFKDVKVDFFADTFSDVIEYIKSN